MVISIPVPDFIVRAVAGKGSVIILGALTTGVTQGLAYLAHYSPTLVYLLGDPSVAADKVAIALTIGIAYLGNAAHLQSGSTLGRVISATAADIQQQAATDLAGKGEAVPAIPVTPQS